MFLAPRLPSPLAGLKELPTQLVIAKWGKNEGTNGSFTVGSKTAKVLPALQKLLGFDTVALDFEHNTLPGTAAYQADKEPRNVAAHSPLQVVEGVGIVANAIQWTPAGEKSVKEGLHPDLSPAIKTDDAGEVVFVHSAALCRQGSVPDLKVFSAADVLSAEQLAAFSAGVARLSTPNPQPSTQMDYKKLLTLLLGLDANASDADIESACTKFSDTVKTVQAHAATVHSLKALTDRLDKLEKSAAASERASLVAQAIAAGKVIPHGAEIDKLDNASFKAVLDALEAGVVPVSQRTPEAVKAFSVSVLTSQNSDAVNEVARQMGNSADSLKKYGDRTR
jgi:phage I-like protein